MIRSIGIWSRTVQKNAVKRSMCNHRNANPLSQLHGDRPILQTPQLLFRNNNNNPSNISKTTWQQNRNFHESNVQSSEIRDVEKDAKSNTLSSDSNLLSPSSLSLEEHKLPVNMIPSDPFAHRKKDIMQYLQNELWHEVDRIIDRIERAESHKLLNAQSRSDGNGNGDGHAVDSKAAEALAGASTSTITLRHKVQEGFRQRKNRNRKRDYHLENNIKRMEHRRKRHRDRDHNRNGLDEVQQKVSFEPPGSAVAARTRAHAVAAIINLDDTINNDDKIENDVVEEEISEDLMADDFVPTNVSIPVHAVPEGSPNSSPSLLDLLDDNDNVKEVHVEMLQNHDGEDGFVQSDLGTPRSSSNLLDLLGSMEAEFTREDENTERSGQIESTSTRTSEKNLLLASLEEDESEQNSKGRNSYLQSKTNLLSLLDDDKYKANDLIDESKSEAYGDEKRNLLDLLDDDDDLVDTTVTNNRQSGSSLLDLLNDDGEGHDSSSLSSRSASPTSLLDLLSGEDDFKGHSKLSGGSLLDLLENDISGGDSVPSTKSTEGSLLDLLDDTGTYELPRPEKDTSSKSLFDLLDDDDLFSDEGDEDDLDLSLDSSSASAKNNNSEQKYSLHDMLADNENNEYQSQGDGQKRSSLLDLLDEVDLDESIDEDLDEDKYANDESMETIETYPLNLAMMRAQALISSMRKSDWSIVKEKIDFKGKLDVDESEDALISDLFGDDEEVEDKTISDESIDHPDSRGDELVDELLLGSSSNQYFLHSDEFNVLLLHVATSTAPDRLKKLLSIFTHMQELEASGNLHSGPNPDTYSILLNFFDRVPEASLIALELCNQMISSINQNSVISNKFKSEEPAMKEDTLEIAMKIQTNRLNIDGAENLMSWALGESGRGITISPHTFKLMLLLYKSDNQQEKALELIKTCLEENNLQPLPGLHKFLINASTWPQRNRQGKQISISSYCESVIRIFEEDSGSFNPSIHIWKKLLSFSLYAARAESNKNWPLAHRCCQAIFSHSNSSQGNIDNKLLQTGIDVAEKMRDPGMTADIICNTNLSPSVHTFDNESSEGSIHQSIPLNSYTKAIKFCVDCGKPSQAERILSHAQGSGRSIPSEVLSNIYTLVLKGYARNGDAEKSLHVFDEMKAGEMQMSESTYAAHIHALAINKRHNDAISVLNTMLDDNNGDSIKPSTSSFAACMLSAMQSRAFEEVIQLNDKMKKAGVPSNSTTFKSTLLASTQLGRASEVMKEIESVLDSQDHPMDAKSFLLCANHLVPGIMKDSGQDIESLRASLRRQIQDNPLIECEAMELNKSLKDCMREDQRRPSKIKNEIMIQRERSILWKQALTNTIKLSRAFQTKSGSM